MPREIGWSQESKLLHQIKKQMKRLTQLTPGFTTTSTTTTSTSSTTTTTTTV